MFSNTAFDAYAASEPQATAYTFEALPKVEVSTIDGDAEFDIAIIGGGLTGLSAALHVARKGGRVGVFEAREIGWGASGRSFGQIVPYLRHDARKAQEILGQDRAARLIDAAAAAPKYIFELIDQLGIDCGKSENGLIMAAKTLRQLDSYKRRADFWANRGVSLQLLDTADTASEIGGGTYLGSILEPRGATVNPLLLSMGIARAAIAAGARVFEHSPISSLSRQSNGWRLETTGGQIFSPQVLMCTDTYTGDLWPDLSARMVYAQGYQVVSAPVSEETWSKILPTNRALTDASRLPSGIRKYANRRIHLSSDVSVSSIPPKTLFHSAARRIRELYPFAKDVQWERAWSCSIGMLPDQFPRLLEPAPGLLIGGGYSGRGMALSVVMGRELARRALTGLAPDEPFPSELPNRWVPGKLSTWVLGASLCAYNSMKILRNISKRQA